MANLRVNQTTRFSSSISTAVELATMMLHAKERGQMDYWWQCASPCFVKSLLTNLTNRYSRRL